jgi:hypothetical protein
MKKRSNPKIESMVERYLMLESERQNYERKYSLNEQLPTQKMKDWFNFSYNKPSETMDELELDEFYSEMRQNFIDDFESELSSLTYIEKCDLFYDLAY